MGALGYDGCALDAPVVPLAPSLYELGPPLGRGSMGVVYRAIHRVSGAPVALKRVRTGPPRPDQTTAVAGTDGSLAPDELRLALAREFRALATLRHPNIISVYDFGFDEQREPFFTMELLERPTSLLDAVVGLPFIERIELLFEVLSALAYLHRHGLVHRDLKPSNIAVSNGHVKVLDFGVSGDAFGTNVVVGTLRYMAPEVMRGQRADASSDLFSFGVIAYQCLTGLHPFHALNDEALAWKVLHAPPDLRPFGIALFDDDDGAPAGDASDSDVPTLVLRSDPLARENKSTSLRAKADAAAPESATLRRVVDPTDLEAVDEGVKRAVGELLRALLAKAPADRPTDAEQVSDLLAAAVGRTYQVPEEARAGFATAARFIGREPELRALTERLDALATHARGGACLIGGESGVGKSRLVDELRTIALVRGIPVVTGQAEAESTTPFDIWIPIFRWLGLASRDPALLSVIAPYVRDLERTLGARITPAPALSGAASFRRLTSTIEGALRRLAYPAIFILEDLHWAGSESLSLLRHITSKLTGLKLLILATYRDDESPSLADELRVMDSMKLARLSFSEIRELSEAMLGHSGTSYAFAEFLFRETEGNVLLATEVARSLPPSPPDESGRDPTEAPPSAPPLASVRRILDRRLAKVPERERRLLEYAAVAGREIDVGLMRALGMSADAIDKLTLHCTAQGIFEAIGATYRFRHDKFREAILDSMGSEQRRIHLEIADALERDALADRDTPASMAGRIAHHLTACGEGDRALPYLEAAATDAVARYANKEAVRYLETAIAIVDARERTEAGDRLLFALHKLLAPALIATRGYAATAVTQAYARARALSVDLALGPAEVFPIDFGLWLYELVRGDMRESLKAAEACLVGVTAPSVAPEVREDLAVEAHRAMGATSYYLGRFRDADDYLRKSIAAHDAIRHADHGFRFGGDPGVVTRLYLSLTCCFRGRTDEAVDLAEEALVAARAIRHPFSEAYAHGFRAWTYQLSGDAARSAESAELAIELSEEHGFPFWLGFGTMLKGYARIHRSEDDLREGERDMRRALEILRGTGAGLWESYWRVLLAEAALAQGADQKALALVEAGVAHAERTGERFALPLLETLRAVVFARHGDDVGASRVLIAARTMALDNDDKLGALHASLVGVRSLPDSEAVRRRLAEDRRPFEGQAASSWLLAR